jgi:hypothetical protein
MQLLSKPSALETPFAADMLQSNVSNENVMNFHVVFTLLHACIYL